MKNKLNSLVVVDMQEKFLPGDETLPTTYLEERNRLILGVAEKVQSTLSRGGIVLNITFGNSSVVPELKELLLADDIGQLRKPSDGIFTEGNTSTRLDGDRLVRKYTPPRSEYFSLIPKKRNFGYPIKLLLTHSKVCEIVGVYTTECVLTINMDFLYIATRMKSGTRIEVIGDLCMCSSSLEGYDQNETGHIDSLYNLYGLPKPIWN